MFCGTFNISSETQEKKTLSGNIIFILDTLKTTFLMENLAQRQTQSVPFFLGIRALFSIFKIGQGKLLPLSLAACLLV